MDELDLTEVSEVFTPLKVSSKFIIHDDNNNNNDDAEIDELTKIPHGLSAKHGRRESHIPTTTRSAGFQITPKRVPLTAPKPNVLNSFPINMMEGPKRQLFKEFKIQKDQQTDENANINHSMSLKRKSSAFEVENESFGLSKVQKVDEINVSIGSIGSILEKDNDDDDDFVLISQANNSERYDDIEIDEKDDEIDEIDEKEELSRIELDNDITSSFVATQVDESISKPLEPIEPTTTEVEIISANLSIQTPSRLTEPVALSPKTEQHSRVADESNLLLDTTKSPNVDDSFLTESPLKPNVSTVSNDLDFLDNFEVISEGSPEPELAPIEKPGYTIEQVRNIESSLQNELAKLNSALQGKGSALVEMDREVNNLKNEVLKLKNDIEVLEFAKTSAIASKESFNIENELHLKEIENLHNLIKEKDARIIRTTHAIQKFKQRVEELNTQIISKDSTVVELTEDIDSKLRAIDVLTDRAKDFEEQASRLNITLTEKTTEFDHLIEKNQILGSQVSFFESELQAKTSEFERLSSNESHQRELYNSINVKLENLTSENQHNLEIIELLNNEKNHLSEQISNLNTHREEIEYQKAQEIAELQSILSANSKDLLLKDVIIQGLTGGTSTLRSSNESLKREIEDLKETLKSTQNQVNEYQELLIIRKAEVDELNIEIESFKDEVTKYAHLTQTQVQEINELKETISTRDSQLQMQHDKVQELDIVLQKQETDHLTELEAFHAEMSNVQTMVSSKSNELYQLKEDKETLSKENDILKYELETYKEEATNFDVKLNSLKAKFNETKINNETLEAQITQLSKEKAVLEAETDKRLQQLAEDLYIQYSKKHEQKVQVLKKGYESKWASKISKFESENSRLKREIEGLSSQLEKEKVEKAEIIKLWDSYKNDEN